METSSTKKLSPGDRVFHRCEGWQGTVLYEFDAGRHLTGEKIHKWGVRTDGGITRHCNASDLILCNKPKRKPVQLLHKIYAPDTPVLCNKVADTPPQLLHKTIDEPLEIPIKKGREVVKQEISGTTVYRLEKVKCGKPNCHSCPHGPYWYAYFRRNGKLVSKYVGKELKDVV
ncbi:MAG TPA: hypothetical protein V6D28_27895 [Leptolyngbyaceae cyanobacterium]